MIPFYNRLDLTVGQMLGNIRPNQRPENEQDDKTDHLSLIHI